MLKMVSMICCCWLAIMKRPLRASVEADLVVSRSENANAARSTRARREFQWRMWGRQLWGAKNARVVVAAGVELCDLE